MARGDITNPLTWKILQALLLTPEDVDPFVGPGCHLIAGTNVKTVYTTAYELALRAKEGELSKALQELRGGKDYGTRHGELMAEKFRAHGRKIYQTYPEIRPKKNPDGTRDERVEFSDSDVDFLIEVLGRELASLARERKDTAGCLELLGKFVELKKQAERKKS